MVIHSNILVKRRDALILAAAAYELLRFLPEEDVEARHRPVAAGDVLLHFHFFAVVELFMPVDLLLEDTEIWGRIGGRAA